MSRKLPEKLGPVFWFEVLGSAFWFVLAYVGFAMGQGGKIVIALFFGALLLLAAAKRIRDLQFARRLKQNPEFLRMHNARNR